MTPLRHPPRSTSPIRSRIKRESAVSNLSRGCQLVRLVIGCSALLLLLLPSPSWACSCTIPSTETAFDRADAVVVGKVVRLSLVGDVARKTSGTVRIEVSPTEVLKGAGTPGSRWVGYGAVFDSACGYDFRVGYEYLIFATRSPRPPDTNAPANSLIISLCGGMEPYGGLSRRSRDQVRALAKRQKR